MASGLLGKLLNWMKTKDFALWLGANRSHSRSYGEDEQQRHGAKDTFSVRSFAKQTTSNRDAVAGTLRCVLVSQAEAGAFLPGPAPA